MIWAFNRAFYVLVFCTLAIAVSTVCNLIYVLPEQRATREQYKAMRLDDAEWEARFKAARSKQIEDEARILWLQHQNLELAKKLTLTLRDTQ